MSKSATPALVLFQILLLAAPGAAGDADAGTAEDSDSDSVDVALPGATGAVPTGNGSDLAGRIDVHRETPPAVAPGTKDLPTWLLELVGLKKPVPPDHKETPEAHHLTVIPFISSSPVMGLGGGVALAGTALLGDPADTTLSKYDFSATITTKSQYAATMRHVFRFSGDDWGLMGMWRWTKWPSPTWGIGSQTPESAKATIDYQLVRAYEVVTRKVVGDLYAGAGYGFDFYYGVSAGPSANGEPTDFSKYPYGTGSSFINSGPTIALVWDSSDSPVYPTRGFVTDFNYTVYPTWLGSSTRWQSVYVDLRTYHQLTNWLVLAFWTYGSFTVGEVPYLGLASNGSDPNERAGRGYIQGRHIGKALLYGEVELRYTIWQWLGAVTGGNIHSVNEPDAKGILHDDPRFKYWYPAVTVGLRLLAVKATRSNICIDYGWGTEGQNGFYLSFNEAF
jgi:hypothetical protein